MTLDFFTVGTAGIGGIIIAGDDGDIITFCRGSMIAGVRGVGKCEVVGKVSVIVFLDRFARLMGFLSGVSHRCEKD